MNEKGELLRELEEEFEKTKKDLGFNVSFEEIENTFSLKDSVLITGFISPNFSRQLCSRIVEYFRDWHGYLNNLLVPNGSYYASQTESKLFNSDVDKKIIWNLIKISMKFSSMHSLIGISVDKELERKFIDDAYIAWKDIFSPELAKILKRVNDGWKKE